MSEKPKPNNQLYSEFNPGDDHEKTHEEHIQEELGEEAIEAANMTGPQESITPYDIHQAQVAADEGRLDAQLSSGRNAVKERFGDALTDEGQEARLGEVIGDDEESRKSWAAYLESRATKVDRAGNLHDMNDGGKFVTSEHSVNLNEASPTEAPAETQDVLTDTTAETSESYASADGKTTYEVVEINGKTYLKTERQPDQEGGRSNRSVKEMSREDIAHYLGKQELQQPASDSTESPTHDTDVAEVRKEAQNALDELAKQQEQGGEKPTGEAQVNDELSKEGTLDSSKDKDSEPDESGANRPVVHDAGDGRRITLHQETATEKIAPLESQKTSDIDGSNLDGSAKAESSEGAGAERADQAGAAEAVAGQELVVHTPTSQELVTTGNEPGKEVVPFEKKSKELVPTEEPSEDKLQFVVGSMVEGTEVQSARDIGQRNYDEMMAAKGGIFRRMARRMIKGRWFGRGFLRSAEGDAARRIAETGRLDDMTAEQWKQFTGESIQRVLADGGTQEMMDAAAGEKVEAIKGEKGERLKGLVDSLVKQYVDGTYNADSLTEEARRQFAAMVKEHPDMAEIVGAGNVYITNIADIAETVKSQVTHERGIDEVLAKVELVSAKLSTGVNAEYKRDRFDNLIDKLPVNSQFLIVGIAGAVGALENLGKMKASVASRVFAGVSAAGVGFAFLDEKKRMAKERVQVERDKAYGEADAISGTKRREALADTLQDMKRADIMIEAMSSLKKDGKYELGSQAEFDALLLAVHDVSARMDVAGRTRMDQIQFSSREKAQGERRAMLIERFNAKKALRQHFEAQRAADPNFAGGVDFDSFMEQGQVAIEQGLIAHSEEKDEQGRRVINIRAAKTAAIVGAVGWMVGEAAQELSSLSVPSLQGVVETIQGKNIDAQQNTPLGALVGILKDRLGGGTASQAPGYNGSNIAGNVLNTQNGTNFDPSTGVLTGPSGQRVDGLHIDANGFDVASVAKLRAAGAWQGESATSIGVPKIETRQVAVDDSLMSQFGKKVSRSWFDNDTGAPNFDLNEQRLDMSADGNGSIVFDGSRMLQGDSFHQGDVANMDFGNYKLLLSVTQGTQEHPLVLDFDASGHAVIPQGSLASQLFERGANGEVIFKGAYAECVQVNGTAADGGLDVQALATVVGNNDAGTIGIPHETVSTSTSRSIRLGWPEAAPAEKDTILPPFMPFVGRDGLRRNVDDKKDEPKPAPAPTGPSGPDGVPPVPVAPPDVRAEIEGRQRSEQPRSPSGASAEIPRDKKQEEKVPQSKQPGQEGAPAPAEQTPPANWDKAAAQARYEALGGKSAHLIVESHPLYAAVNTDRRAATSVYRQLTRNYQRVIDEGERGAPIEIPAEPGNAYQLGKNEYVSSHPAVLKEEQAAFEAFAAMEDIRRSLTSGTLTIAEKDSANARLREAENAWKAAEARVSAAYESVRGEWDQLQESKPSGEYSQPDGAPAKEQEVSSGPQPESASADKDEAAPEAPKPTESDTPQYAGFGPKPQEQRSGVDDLDDIMRSQAEQQARSEREQTSIRARVSAAWARTRAARERAQEIRDKLRADAAAPGEALANDAGFQAAQARVGEAWKLAQEADKKRRTQQGLGVAAEREAATEAAKARAWYREEVKRRDQERRRVMAALADKQRNSANK